MVSFTTDVWASGFTRDTYQYRCTGLIKIGVSRSSSSTSSYFLQQIMKRSIVTLMLDILSYWNLLGKFRAITTVHHLRYAIKYHMSDFMF